MDLNDKRYKDSTIEWMRATDWKSPFAVTTTLKQARLLYKGSYEPGTREAYDHNDKYFFDVLNKALYGNNKKHRVRAMSVLERSHRDGDHSLNGRWHGHKKIETPPNIAPETFSRLIAYSWQLSDWAYQETVIKAADAGWDDYLLKFYTKPDSYCDNILWRSCSMEPSPPAMRNIDEQLSRLWQKYLQKCGALKR